MIKDLHEKLKAYPRINVLNIIRYTKLSMSDALQVLDELLEYRFEIGIIEEKSKIKFGRKNVVKSVKSFTKLHNLGKLDKNV